MKPHRIWITFSIVLLLGFVFWLPKAAAQTITFDFTGGTLGAGCDTIINGPLIASVVSPVDSIVNAANAGGTAPECQAPVTMDINLVQPANAIAFRIYKGAGSIGLEFYLAGASVATDSIASGAAYSYSRTITFDRIRIFEVTTLSPIYLDNLELTFDDAVVASIGIIDRGFVPGDDRIAPAAGARFNAYCHDYGIVVYVGGAPFLVERSLLSTQPPTVHTLIAEQNGVTFHHLSDGLFQLMIEPDAEGKQEFVIFELGEECAVVRWRRGLFDTLTVHSTIYAESAAEHWANYPADY